jgi:hypothetical protein
MIKKREGEEKHHPRLSVLFVAAALTLVAAAAWAAEPAAGRASDAGATTAATASPQPAAGPATSRAEVIPAEVPAPFFLSACMITKECVCGGGYVEICCYGNVSCTQHARFITCDGVNTYCPPIGSCPP